MLALAVLYPAVSPAQSSSTRLPKLIKIVVPFEPGGSTDIFARLLAQKLGARIGSTVVVENRTGATGLIGAAYVSRATPDGSTLMVMGSTFTVTAAVRAKLPFDPVGGFAPVAMLGSGPQILAVGNDTPYLSTAQLLDAARANKGKINYGSIGIGSSQHLNTALLNSMAGSEMTHVPFKGGAPAVSSLISGHIQVMMIGYSALMPHVKAGRIRALAVTSASRSRFAPELPTVAETVPGFSVEVWWSVFAPAATPQPVVELFNTEIRAIVLSPEMRDAFDREGVDPASMTAGEFAAFVRSDIEKWRDVARKLNIVLE